MKVKALILCITLLPSMTLAAPPPLDPAMLELADQSRCLTCHDVDETLRGPAWRDVAKRYRGQPEVEDILVKKVYEGGGGAWGNDYMSANKRAGMDNIRILVRWILTLP
ncbi:MAG TPA: cytochrome C [Candidatus Accumulibacter phosphatis]|nr:MAG: Cytochrome c8 [Candidatus Accumulibacter sp. SK-11]HAY27771.1 cytochrome C [Accumulibacter sp.]HRL75491.1 cytochrome C [Candidatus Accumulibacter phosphatis]HCN69780.1 cytochrome C [Accumulibacter sp.]HCV14022.1 cytochrome C [Accumulibacter sp.]